MKLLKLPKSLLDLPNPPKQLFYKGNTKLLKNKKVAIVGTRAPNQYTKALIPILVKHISKYATIISGGAIGVDKLAHIHSFPNTIMVSPSSLDIYYPLQNKKLIQDIENKALILSEYEKNYSPHRYSFLDRNRIVIALSSMVILPQGDINSGTSYSAKLALKLKKPIFTIPHRLGESALTNSLLEDKKAEAIYNIDNFINKYFSKQINDSSNEEDEILEFCKNAPSFEDALLKFGDKILEYELMGLLIRENNYIKTC